MVFWLFILALFLLAFAALGGIAWALTRSRGAGVAAGLAAAVLATAHVLYAIVNALGEYEGESTGYDKLVEDHFWELFAAYTILPAVLIVGVARLVSGRSRSSSSPPPPADGRGSDGPPPAPTRSA